MTERESWGFAQGEEIVPGRFAIARMGGGARFEVYLGTDDLLMQAVVIKLLRPDRVSSAESLRALEREAHVLSALAHPVIVRSFDARLDGPRPHIVMEHLEGPTLRALVKHTGPLPLEQVAPLALQLCSALHYMARCGYAHLDVKPANVVMSMTPRLIDLSIARPVAEAARLQVPVGTGAYMSPEQCAPGVHGHPGAASDVWALGVTLYYALEGRRPFGRVRKDAEAPAERYPQLEQPPRPFERRLPMLLEETIMACLRKEQDARPAPQEIAERLEPIVGALPLKPRLARRRPGR